MFRLTDPKSRSKTILLDSVWMKDEHYLNENTEEIQF